MASILPAPPPPPGGHMDVVFTLDSTGSMSQALEEVKGRVSDMMQRLLADIPGIKMAAVAHGDYCDEHVFYLTQAQNLTSNLPELVNFVVGVEGTVGGDTAECYELVLKMVRENLDWTPGSQRIVVMIGDAYPHLTDDPNNRDGLDWEEQVRLLSNMGAKIYGVQVFEDEQSSAFFSKMAEATGGQHLKLTQFGHLCDVIMAICYREKGAEFLENFEVEVQERTSKSSAPNPDLEGVFDVLRRGNTNSSTSDVRTAMMSSTVGPVGANSARSTSDPSSAVTCAPYATTSSAERLGRKISEPRSSDVTPTTSPDTSDSSSLPSSRKRAAKLTSYDSDMSLDCIHPLFDHWSIIHQPKRRKLQPKKKPIRKSKPKYSRLPRERVPDSNFRFKSLSWSPWKVLAVPAHEEVTSGKWGEILSGQAKFREDVHQTTQTLKSGHYHKTLFLELSVQTSPGRKRHVTWRRVVTLYVRRLSFRRLLTSGRYMRAQMARVMRSGCRVFLRLAEVGRGRSGTRCAEEMERELDRQYDYAWCPRSRAKVFRDVMVSTQNKRKEMQIAGPHS